MMTTAEALRQDGLNVIEAETADAAAELLRAAPESVSVVFSDIETPGVLDGLALAQMIDSLWPNLPVVLTSGRVKPAEGAIPPSMRFVCKPYDVSHIHDVIRTLAER